MRWRGRLVEEERNPAVIAAAMRAVNPAFIPRNHRVEAIFAAVVEQGDFGPFEELSAVLSRPYVDQPAHARYAEVPEGGGADYRTFCGT